MQKKDTFRKLRKKICECIIAPYVTVITLLRKTLPMIKLKQCFACKKRKLFVKKRAVPLSTNLFANSREEFCNKCYLSLKDELKDKFKYE